MAERFPLCEAQEQQRVVIVSMQCSSTLRKRLREMGVVEGTEIISLQPCFLGDPRGYQVRGTVLYLRNADTQRILCQKVAK